MPLLIVPPWINKFYILDLTQPKVVHPYVVDAGLHRLRHLMGEPGRHASPTKSFVDYMKEGLLRAADSRQAKRPAKKQVQRSLGYCVGGTLLSATLAYLADAR